MPDPDLVQLAQEAPHHEFPAEVVVETVAECDLACIMCPQSRLTRPRGRMAYELWTRIVDEIAEVEPATLLRPAHLGEPLLMAPEIFRWLRYAKHRGLEQVSLASNLNLLRPDHAESLVTSGLDEISVGIDAASLDRYREIRVEGNLERVRRAVTYLADTRARLASSTPRLVLHYLVMDENAAEQEAFAEAWQATGIDLELRFTPRLGWAGHQPAWQGSSRGRGAPRRPCHNLMTTLTVFWNGLVPQCERDWNGRTRHGNLNRQSLHEVWHASLAQLRQRHLRGDFRSALCCDCEDWGAVEGRSLRCGESVAAARST
jgi:MoaA/NifB/PqqE/SkfB family radical SAM enzyme